MSLSKVILFLLIVSTAEVDCRALRKRRQEPRSSAYYGISGLSSYPYFGYGLGSNLYPIGNNWYVPGIPPYPYNYPFGYNPQLNPYLSNYGYPNSFNGFGNVQYGNGALNNLYSDLGQPYTGQSYMPTSNEWLPLPGYDRRRRRRRQLLESVMVPKMNDNFALSTGK